MKKIAGLLFVIMIATSACASVPPEVIGLPAGMSMINTPTSIAKIEATKRAAANHLPPLNATWQIQYASEMDYTLKVDIYNLNLFETDAVVIAQLHERGIFVICHFSAGSFEDWRPDAKNFLPSILGKKIVGWNGKTWLDIRQIEVLKPIMTARLDIAAQNKCDGVDPDNIDGYTRDTGFPLSYNDQLAYNISIATLAHERGLSIGLKNDLEQIPDLISYFDWALNEECFSNGKCDLLLPFTQAGKPVFVIEYELAPEKFCSQANGMNFNALQKKRDLDSFRFSCR